MRQLMYANSTEVAEDDDGNGKYRAEILEAEEELIERGVIKPSEDAGKYRIEVYKENTGRVVCLQWKLAAYPWVFKDIFDD